jgi:hypothetical protein
MVECWNNESEDVILELPSYAGDYNDLIGSALHGWVDDDFKYYAKDMMDQRSDVLMIATFNEA